MYIDNKPTRSPDTIYVGGIKKAELEKLIGHKVILPKLKWKSWDWVFLITVEDAVNLKLMTVEQAKKRYFQMKKKEPRKDYPKGVNEKIEMNLREITWLVSILVYTVYRMLLVNSVSHMLAILIGGVIIGLVPICINRLYRRRKKIEVINLNKNKGNFKIDFFDKVVR